MNSFKRLVLPAAFAAAAIALIVAARASYPTASKNAYAAKVLVSNQPGAPVTDKNLKNPWGVAFAPGSPFWIADNNSGLSTLYDGTARSFRSSSTSSARQSPAKGRAVRRSRARPASSSTRPRTS